jgi:uncharacterized membrane protein YphA (DoxX/SURF4 family)
VAEANPIAALPTASHTGSAVRILLILGRVALGGIFLYAAYEKLHDPWMIFAMTVNSYQMLPEWGVIWMARILPWVEVGLGALLIIGVGLRWVGSATIALLLVFITAMARAILLRLEINCGCFGAHSVKVSTELWRACGYLLLALIVTAGAFLSRRAGRPAA